MTAVMWLTGSSRCGDRAVMDSSSVTAVMWLSGSHRCGDLECSDASCARAPSFGGAVVGASDSVGASPKGSAGGVRAPATAGRSRSLERSLDAMKKPGGSVMSARSLKQSARRAEWPRAADDEDGSADAPLPRSDGRCWGGDQGASEAAAGDAGGKSEKAGRRRSGLPLRRGDDGESDL